MRDILWTIIIIWAVFKLLDVFRSFSAGKTRRTNGARTSGSAYNYQKKPEGSITVESKNSTASSDKKSKLNPNDGEYVDFEEVK